MYHAVISLFAGGDRAPLIVPFKTKESLLFFFSLAVSKQSVSLEAALMHCHGKLLKLESANA